MEKDIYNKLKINLKSKNKKLGFKLKTRDIKRTGIIRENDDKPFFKIIR